MNSGHLGFDNSLLEALSWVSEDAVLSLHVVSLSDFFFSNFFFSLQCSGIMTALGWRNSLGFLTSK